MSLSRNKIETEIDEFLWQDYLIYVEYVEYTSFQPAVAKTTILN